MARRWLISRPDTRFELASHARCGRPALARARRVAAIRHHRPHVIVLKTRRGQALALHYHLRSLTLALLSLILATPKRAPHLHAAVEPPPAGLAILPTPPFDPSCS